ncbi:MAG: glycosyltransferase family 2 protein [Candidatus Sulfotelmatobacter sp.]|jgi:glycosyltransferase involved in cell wall biosynthesis
MTLSAFISVVIITHNEEANLGRTLQSISPLLHAYGTRNSEEVIVVDSGSTDRTIEIAKSFGAKVFVEEWKGYAAQKNSAIDKATGAWILSLDADEAVSPELLKEIGEALGRQILLRSEQPPDRPVFVDAFSMPRQNIFLLRPIRHGGFWPDRKVRLFRKGKGRFAVRPVHESVQVTGRVAKLSAALLHHSYPTLADYIEHMNRYSSLGAEMVVAEAGGKVRFSVINVMLRPFATFLYNYIFRLGFLDGREGLLLHLYHAVYVSWKYAKAWELSRKLS